MKAREWLQRSRERHDPMDAFSDVWRAFNNLYATNRLKWERDKICGFLEAKITEQQAQEVISGHVGDIEYLLSEPVVDMRGNGRDTGENIERYKTANEALSKLKELFLVVYQVRCNLEHGQKSLSRERDVRLCKAAAPLVAYVVERNI